ncbi:MAG: enoyl-CoA hydratase/isomerase family protein [Gemmatimonadaceae bacterium]|nr:enoyl-CoA hydratase/isomerase family protein [Acetobacteraceae bacterium]
MLTQVRDGATAILTLDQPARRNALAMAMRAALVDALEAIEADRGVRAIVITGAGGTFCAGGDISGMDATDVAAGRERFRLTHRLVRLLIKGSKPIVAAVEGWCVGAGLSVAMCCDTVVAADDARFAAGFGKVGLVADLGLLHTLPARIGQGRARQMLLYGETMAAAAAHQVGLADHLVPPGTALAAALARAVRFADMAPLPIALTRQYLAAGLDAALDWERDTQSMLFLTADHAEGKAAFLAKRPPVFGGT